MPHDDGAPWWAPGPPTAFGLRDGRPLPRGGDGGGAMPRAATAARCALSSPPPPLASLTASANVKLSPQAAPRRHPAPAPRARTSPFARLAGGGDASRPWWPFGGGNGGGGGPASKKRAGAAKSVTDGERVLVSDVVLTGVDDERLLAAARGALTLKPNYAYTLGEVQEDVSRVFDTGYFTSATPTAEDSRDGVVIRIALTAYPALRGLVVTGADALPVRVLEDAFARQAGATINYGDFQAALDGVSGWYGARGVPARVVVRGDGGAGGDGSRGDGVIHLHAVEPIVRSVALRFTDRVTGEPKEGGGYTRPAVVLRHLRTRRGAPYSAALAREDIDAVYATGLFDDVNIVPAAAPGSSDDAPLVDVTLSLAERKMGGVSAGGGIAASGAADGALPGFIGSASFSQRNLWGSGQKLAATLEAGQVDKLFRVHWADPWLAGDAHHTSRTVSLQNTRSSGTPIHGAPADDAPPPGGSAVSLGDLPDDGAAGGGDGGAGIVVARLTGGVEYTRPLGPSWTGTAGLAWQRSRCVDEAGKPLAADALGAPLTFRGDGAPDTLATALLRVAHADAGGEVALSMEQALQLRPSWLNFNRLRARAARSLSLAPLGAPRWRATLSARGGTVVGDLPPYEAFAVGGTNSVRGYGEGALGTGRSYAEATAELAFPLAGALEGALFADVGSDLESGATVPGDPAGARGKPGAGAAVGVGVRVDSPVGPLRFEFAVNDTHARRFHVGIGAHG